MKKLYLLTLILFSISSASAQKPDWFRKLQELEKFPSTEKDVERLFSPKTIKITKTPNEWGKVIEYEIPEGKLMIYYSTGKCSEENKVSFDLNDGVILDLNFWLNNPIDFSKLKLKLKGFIKGREDDIEIYFYTNKEKGITYTVFQEKLKSIRFFYPQIYSHSCKNQK